MGREGINLPTTGENLRLELTLNQTDSRLPERDRQGIA